VYEVFVRGLELVGHHGATDAEQEVGHRLRVDATATVDGRAPETDAVADTVDYVALATAFLAISSERRYRTLEALAEAFCRRVLDGLPGVQEIEVTVEKVAPPAEIVAESTGVRMVKVRE
jgi:7,8-dihydroneopterin aldolase/epimerase/oxygenase